MASSDPTGAAGPPDRHEAVRSFFGSHRAAWRDRYGEDTFDAYNYRARAGVARRFLASIAGATPARLLEVGCGAGVQAAEASAAGWHVVATDLTRTLLHLAREQHAGPAWVAAAAEALPFREGRFDAAMMLGVIGYVDDPTAVLRCLRGQLRSGGHLIVSWATEDPLLDRVSRATSALPVAAYARLRGRSSDAVAEEDLGFYRHYNRYWSLEAFLRLLQASGFRSREVRAVNFGALRFMGKAPWSHRGDISLSRLLEAMSGMGVGRWLRGGARTLVCLAQRA